MSYIVLLLFFLFLFFVDFFYVPVNNFSVMLGQVLIFLGLNHYLA